RAAADARNSSVSLAKTMLTPVADRLSVISVTAFYLLHLGVGRALFRNWSRAGGAVRGHVRHVGRVCEVADRRRLVSRVGGRHARRDRRGRACRAGTADVAGPVGGVPPVARLDRRVRPARGRRHPGRLLQRRAISAGWGGAAARILWD